MIEVKGLTKHYGDFVAIQDVNFTVKEGEIVGFLGPNGAGKSTTMKILTCFMPATYGTAFVEGFDIFEAPMEVKRRIGYLPEYPPLYQEMTVSSYLGYVAEIKRVPMRRRASRIDEVMAATSIDHVADRLIANLSRGYQQRVGIAQALVHEPRVLILDEPTVGLDPNQIREVRDLIRELRKNHTIILSTHILQEVSATCERIIIINEGRIVADGTPDELSRTVGGGSGLQLKIKGPADDVLAAVGKLDGVAKVVPLESREEGLASLEVQSAGGKDLREGIFTLMAGKGWPIYELRPPGVGLEEVFVRLTTRDTEVNA